MNYDKQYRGPQVAAGWMLIVEEMLVALKDLPITIVQIKEKFGQLRVYADYVTYEQATEIAEIIEIATYKARHTCEICGEPGKPVNTNILGVRCEAHV